MGILSCKRKLEQGIKLQNDALFKASSFLREPLAARMRPRNLDEYIGQDHIVGKGRLLRRAIAADQLTSVIFYGPPGTGKTTLARVIANHTKSNFLTLNAVLSGVQSIRDSIKCADEQHKLYGKKTILFVDEVHRWNKSQQDALLPWVENGTIILVGATTENPFFEVNKALVSRSSKDNLCFLGKRFFTTVISKTTTTSVPKTSLIAPKIETTEIPFANISAMAAIIAITPNIPPNTFSSKSNLSICYSSTIYRLSCSIM